MPFGAGTRLGSYEIIARVGAGGMGVVYRARDLRLGRQVAVKVLTPDLAANADALHRFEREARAIALLNHPNICTLFDLGVDRDTQFIVMELLEGHTLNEIMHGTPLDFNALLRWAIQVASALEAAHARGIVHRDIKPGNIFITHLNVAKLLDFGLAKFAMPITASSEKDDRTLTAVTMRGVVLGTVPYMSPEQAQAQEAGAQSDLFSLGAVLYEMTTGHRAFPGNSAAEICAAILNAAPVPPTRLNAYLPREFEAVVTRLLEKSPEARHASASELVTELQFMLGRSSQSARAAAQPGSAPTPRAAEHIRSLAVLPLVNLSPDSSEDYFVDRLTEALITAVARLGGIRVISRTSAMCYKQTKKSVAAIAQELNADAIVEGSVLRSGRNLRINCRLIDPRSEDLLWCESFNHHLRDILAVHDDLTKAIASGLRTHIQQGSVTYETPRSINPESYDAYLRGRYFWNKRNEPNLRKAIECFQHALDGDPLYAPAWTGIADSYFYLGYSFGRMEPSEAMPKAKAAALRAL